MTQYDENQQNNRSRFKNLDKNSSTISGVPLSDSKLLQQIDEFKVKNKPVVHKNLIFPVNKLDEVGPSWSYTRLNSPLPTRLQVNVSSLANSTEKKVLSTWSMSLNKKNIEKSLQKQNVQEP